MGVAGCKPEDVRSSLLECAPELQRQPNFLHAGHALASNCACNTRCADTQQFVEVEIGEETAPVWDFVRSQVAEPPDRDVQLHCRNLAVCRAESAGLPRSSDWRRRYRIGRALGAGSQGTVYEAWAKEATPQQARADDERKRAAALGEVKCSCGRLDGLAQGMEALGLAGWGMRLVALKRFESNAVASFQREVQIMRRVGVHPNVVRLLESYEGAGLEPSALVFEHCDRGDLYEFYAAEHRRTRGAGVPEERVAALMWQALQALERLQEVGVEHRDIKPENMLLFGCTADRAAAPRLKLTDFGWSCLVGVQNQAGGQAADGSSSQVGGSLGYSPPELSPQPTSPRSPGSARGGPGRRNSNRGPSGSTDMWGIGVVSYLLLVGRGPFKHKALALANRTAEGNAHAKPEDVEDHVLDLIHSGAIDREAIGWSRLSVSARNFVEGLIRPDPAERFSLADAMRHPFLNGPRESLSRRTSQFQLDNARRRLAWGGLDGLQRLGWLAVAHAVSEAELPARTVDLATRGAREGKGRYHELLAGTMVMSIADTPVRTWVEVAHLAFRYLDLDCDGELSMDDLLKHIEDREKGLSPHPSETALSWVLNWRSLDHTLGLTFSDFHHVLSEAARTAAAVLGGGDGHEDFLREGSGWRSDSTEAPESPMPKLQGRSAEAESLAPARQRMAPAMPQPEPDLEPQPLTDGPADGAAAVGGLASPARARAPSEELPEMPLEVASEAEGTRQPQRPLVSVGLKRGELEVALEVLAAPGREDTEAKAAAPAKLDEADEADETAAPGEEVRLEGTVDEAPVREPEEVDEAPAREPEEASARLDSVELSNRRWQQIEEGACQFLEENRMQQGHRHARHRVRNTASLPMPAISEA